ncbi:MAG: hypothetical protein ABFS28_10190 [Bacteroidota bacterium]
MNRRRLSCALVRADSAEIREFSGNLERMKEEQGWTEAYYEKLLTP